MVSSMATNRYLIKPDAGQWLLEHNGGSYGRFPSREEAFAAARQRAAVEGAEIVTVDAEGFLVDHERFGSRGGGDPVG